MQELKHAYDTRHDNISKLHNYIKPGQNIICFSVATPTFWNQPSKPMKSSKTIATFRNKLKTPLFEVTFLL